MLDSGLHNLGLVHPDLLQRRVQLAIEPKPPEVSSNKPTSDEPVVQQDQGDRITHVGNKKSHEASHEASSPNRETMLKKDHSEFLTAMVKSSAKRKPPIDPKAQALASNFLELPVLKKSVTKLKDEEKHLEFVRYTQNHYLFPPSETFIKGKLLENLLYNRMHRLFDESHIDSKKAETVEEQNHNINALLNTLDAGHVDSIIDNVMTEVGGHWDPAENWPPVRDHLLGLKAFVNGNSDLAAYSRSYLEAQANGKRMLT
jgi:hypothetical protein